VFTPSHRGGSGSPLVLLHGFTDTWRTWELVLPALERRHDVLAPTLLGHAGGPPLPREVSAEAVADAVERAMDEAGFETAHLAGNSFGGYVALHLAARGRARSVVAFAPAGGWAEGDESYKETLAFFPAMQDAVQSAAPNAGVLMASARGRRRATESSPSTSSTSRPSCSPTS
jgi:pimeloyl-ACP methyl ester carboxylesterase